MDGSCNGLQLLPQRVDWAGGPGMVKPQIPQIHGFKPSSRWGLLVALIWRHYAALGRDVEGAKVRENEIWQDEVMR